MSSEPFPTSLCHRCKHHRYVKTARSTFIRCAVLEIKYPPQPVVTCAVFVEAEPSNDDARDTDTE